MPTPQDTRLRALLDDVITDLAGKIREIVLEDLFASLDGSPSRAPKPASRGKRTAPRISAPKAPTKRTKHSKPKVSRDPAAAAERRKKILGVLGATGKGMSASEVAKAAGLPRETVNYSLRVLRKEKRVFMAGQRAGARWAASADAAKKAASSG